MAVLIASPIPEIGCEGIKRSAALDLLQYQETLSANNLRRKNGHSVYGMHIPKYRRNKSKNRAFVEFKKKRCYLPGAFGSAESKTAYAKFIADNIVSKGPVIVPGKRQQTGISVLDLCTQYLAYFKTLHLDDLRGVYANQKYGILPFARAHSHLRADTIGPKHLKEWQKRLADEERSRSYINANISYILKAFRWGAAEELIPASVSQNLYVLPRIRRGETKAKERKKKKPAEQTWVNSVLPHLSPTLQTMLMLQYHTGVRSQSVCMARPSQFTTEDEFLIWCPRHKLEKWGIELVLPLGPRAQLLLVPFLADKTDRWLFVPRGRNSYGKPTRYNSNSYRSALQDGVDRLNAARQKAGLEKLPMWTPHQLRHAKGHMVRDEYGIEAVQAVLGHTRLATSEIYSASRLKLAKLVAKETG